LILIQATILASGSLPCLLKVIAALGRVGGGVMLSVSLLGVFRVADVDDQLWSDLGQGGRGLASFLLAYPDRPHRRERLADLFWPELDAERGRRALNSAVWRLRKLLGPATENKDGRNLRTVGSETILERTPWLDIDAWALQQATVLALDAPDTIPALEKLKEVVAALYRYEGPFLDGDDGDWILEERERLHSQFVRATLVVVRQFGSYGLYDHAIRLARHALRFDPFREELVRLLITLLALDERRFEAIRYYESWSDMLRRELGLSPLAATRAVLQEIRNPQEAEGPGHLRALFVRGNSPPSLAS
jgi:DNA-binding SARP family transcriptional activator